MQKKTIGRGRGITITEVELDAGDLSDMFAGKRASARPVSVTYYKPTRDQHYAAMGKIYGVARKPNQSSRAYARQVEKVMAAAAAKHRERGGA